MKYTQAIPVVNTRPAGSVLAEVIRLNTPLRYNRIAGIYVVASNGVSLSACTMGMRVNDIQVLPDNFPVRFIQQDTANNIHSDFCRLGIDQPAGGSVIELTIAYTGDFILFVEYDNNAFSTINKLYKVGSIQLLTLDVVRDSDGIITSRDVTKGTYRTSTLITTDFPVSAVFADLKRNGKYTTNVEGVVTDELEILGSYTQNLEYLLNGQQTSFDFTTTNPADLCMDIAQITIGNNEKDFIKDYNIRLLTSSGYRTILQNQIAFENTSRTIEIATVNPLLNSNEEILVSPSYTLTYCFTYQYIR